MRILIAVLLSFFSLAAQATTISVDFVASAMDMGGMGLGRYSPRDGAGNFTFNTEGFSNKSKWTAGKYWYQDSYNSDLASLSISNRSFSYDFNLREHDPSLSYLYERTRINVHVWDDSVNAGLDMFEISISNDYRSYDSATGITRELYEFMYVNIATYNTDFIFGGQGLMPTNFDESFLGNYRGHGYFSVTDKVFKDTSDPRYLEPVSTYGARSGFQIAGLTQNKNTSDESNQGRDTQPVPSPPTILLFAIGLVGVVLIKKSKNV